MTQRIHLLGMSILLLSSPHLRAQEADPETYHKPAIFEVTEEIVNPDVQPFAATISSIGNSLFPFTSGYEPLSWRSRWFASEDAKGKAIVGPSLSHHNTLGDGLLDGGWVRIYRIQDAEMRVIAESKIPENGFVLRGWNVTSSSRAIPVGTEEFLLKWPIWEDTKRPYWYAIATIDKQGDVSEPSVAVEVIPPANFADAPKIKHESINVRGRSDGELPSAPNNLKSEVVGDGTVRLTWDPVEGEDVAGYLLLSSYFAPSEMEGFFIRLDDPNVEVLAGDMIVAGKYLKGFTSDMISPRIYGASRAWKDLFGNRFRVLGLQDTPKNGFSWQLVDHTPDTIVEDAGETYLQLTLEPGAAPYSLGDYTHSGSAQGFREVLKPTEYKIDFWMRYEGESSPAVPFTVDGYDIEPLVFHPTSEWQRFTGIVTIPSVMEGKVSFRSQLLLSEPGIYSVDNLRFYRADTDYLDYTPEDYQRLKESGMSALRTHGPIKTGRSTYSMEQFLNPAGVLTGIRYSNTLPQMLGIMEKAGVDPWLQIEFHMSPEEWLAFAEFMAAPYDPTKDSPETKPHAAKRYAQGREKPWIDAFDTVYFELSNETWNGLFHPWLFENMPDAVTGQMYNGGNVYGMFQEHVIDMLRSSPYWTAEMEAKFDFVIGGWHNGNYGIDAAQYTPNSTYITNANYNGGWDEGEGAVRLNKPSYFNILMHVNQVTHPRSQKFVDAIAPINESRPADNPALLGVYEAGPGYLLSGLGAVNLSDQRILEQELVMKSRTSGVGTLDSFLARARDGYRLDNFFTFGEGDTWSSHAEWYRGGQAYPQWMVLSLVNKLNTPDMLAVKATSVPAIDLPGWKRRVAVDDAPLAACYAMQGEERLSVFLINRKLADYPQAGDDGQVPFTVNLPISSAESVRVYYLSGDYDTENYTAPNVELIEEELQAEKFDGTLQVTLPAASMRVFVLDGVK